MSSELAHPVLRFLRKITAPDGSTNIADTDLLRRFVVQQDQAAFAGLVRRHGPMVWGVCRRVLHDAHEAEDAYQATFLVLLRKAHGLRKPESLGNWLYGVAYRTALHAKAEAARRRAQPRQTLVLAAADPVEELLAREMRLVLEDELNQLPSKYRAPLVLCYLEGQTQEEAARSLGCPRKTITTRLTRARERLRTRLLRRGLTVSTTTLAAALLQNLGSASRVPMPGVDSTVQAAVQFAWGKAAVAGVVSARAFTLAKGVLTSMLVNQVKNVAVLVLAVAVATGVGVGTYRVLAGGQGVAGADDKPKTAAEDAKKDPDKKTDKEKLQGAWIPIAVESNGKKATEQEIKERNFEMVFTDNKVTVPVKNETKEAVYKLDPAKKPKHIDVTVGDETALGIYLLEGDTLKVCVAEPGNERPAEFASTQGSKIILMELKKK